MPRTSAQYDALAEQALQNLLAHEHAVVWPEVEAKLAERPYRTPEGDTLRGVDPHHLTNARHSLAAAGILQASSRTTRGGQSITTLSLTTATHQTTAISRAAARKRLLYARYLSWARASKSGSIPNVVGVAGEDVLHASLKAAAAEGAGYGLVPRSHDGVTSLFGQPIQGGALDAIAYLTAPPSASEGPLAVTVLFEAKNLRHWIYDSNSELFQLLDKAARLQLKYPDRPFVPVLVCRRAYNTAFNLAKSLGFRIFYTQTQPLRPHSTVKPYAVEEVNNELGFNLSLDTGPHPHLTNALATNLPHHARDLAARWARAAPIVATFAQQLRDSGLLARNPTQRKALEDRFRQAIATQLTP